MQRKRFEGVGFFLTATLTFLSSFFIFYLSSPLFSGSARFWLIFGSLVVFCGGISLHAATIRTISAWCVVLFGIIFSAHLPYIFSAPAFSLLSSSASLIFFLFVALYTSRQYIANSVSIRFFSVARIVVSRSFTGLALAFVLLTIPSIVSPSVLVSQEQFTRFVSGSSVFFEWIGGGKILDQWLVHSFQNIVRSQLSANPKFQSLPDSAKYTLVQNALEQAVRSQGEERITPGAFERIFARTFYSFLSDTLARWQRDFADAFPVFWGIIAFLVIRSILWLFQFPVIFCCGLFFELLRAFSFVTITTTTIPKERVEFV